MNLSLDPNWRLVTREMAMTFPYKHWSIPALSSASQADLLTLEFPQMLP